MMLNLQFAETMELTEAELQEVSGGDIVNIVPGVRGGTGWGVAGIYPGWGNQGMSPHRGAFDWAVEPTGEWFRRRR